MDLMNGFFSLEHEPVFFEIHYLFYYTWTKDGLKKLEEINQIKFCNYDKIQIKPSHANSWYQLFLILNKTNKPLVGEVYLDNQKYLSNRSVFSKKKAKLLVLNVNQKDYEEILTSNKNIITTLFSNFYNGLLIKDIKEKFLNYWRSKFGFHKKVIAQRLLNTFDENNNKFLDLEKSIKLYNDQFYNARDINLSHFNLLKRNYTELVDSLRNYDEDFKAINEKNHQLLNSKKTSEKISQIYFLDDQIKNLKQRIINLKINKKYGPYSVEQLNEIKRVKLEIKTLKSNKRKQQNDIKNILNNYVKGLKKQCSFNQSKMFIESSYTDKIYYLIEWFKAHELSKVIKKIKWIKHLDINIINNFINNAKKIINKKADSIEDSNKLIDLVPKKQIAFLYSDLRYRLKKIAKISLHKSDQDINNLIVELVEENNLNFGRYLDDFFHKNLYLWRLKLNLKESIKLYKLQPDCNDFFNLFNNKFQSAVYSSNWSSKFKKNVLNPIYKISIDSYKKLYRYYLNLSNTSRDDIQATIFYINAFGFKLTLDFMKSYQMSPLVSSYSNLINIRWATRLIWSQIKKFIDEIEIETDSLTNFPKINFDVKSYSQTLKEKFKQEYKDYLDSNNKINSAIANRYENYIVQNFLDIKSDLESNTHIKLNLDEYKKEIEEKINSIKELIKVNKVRKEEYKKEYLSNNLINEKRENFDRFNKLRNTIKTLYKNVRLVNRVLYKKKLLKTKNAIDIKTISSKLNYYLAIINRWQYIYNIFIDWKPTKYHSKKLRKILTELYLYRSYKDVGISEEINYSYLSFLSSSDAITVYLLSKFVKLPRLLFVHNFKLNTKHEYNVFKGLLLKYQNQSQTAIILNDSDIQLMNDLGTKEF
ncbi:hypothetical protein [Mycoplasma bradburyae]|uniref:DUF2357 domain-containing protein n=1 Tax=Mycoplasma bradburyae TaxID=2963128 RepID=A0AAW6HR76_9MOLU|nr:hypothetical protein [Mycoplasma bradburyae]MDC4181742.1 hypothetical protein [Mycoplasma bradburyae]MDC4182449.1 hypothetical protein [Mycoplasma bradburyae]MDC4183668.1 hypothetical protein [Mycoplasma bradburyae]UTS70213.1 hypothetical protein NMG68_00430 [Mycoplasma bradburyae]UTS70937.1 hypothetical protein NMG77_00415 [Mycoplasma bradburyae]